MKQKTVILLLIVAFIAFSCKREEPLNMEADMLSIDFEEDILQQPIIPVGELVNVFLYDSVNLENLTPILKITEGATVKPASGVPQDFSKMVKYTVTSEDGQYSRIYRVNLFVASQWQFDFESWDMVSGVYENPTGWSSGNAGVKISNGFLSADKKMDYPTYKSTDAQNGMYSVEMQSRKGGQSPLIPKLISGSVFLGDFSTIYALTDPLKCPQFGVPYLHNSILKPQKLSGWIKYTPGASFQDETGTIISGKTDQCSFYAVLFEGNEPLTARDVLTSERIIAKAVLPDNFISSNYTYIEIPFSYNRAIPEDKPLQITIVASSSKDGDYYRGAVGSKLNIDNVKIIFN